MGRTVPAAFAAALIFAVGVHQPASASPNLIGGLLSAVFGGAPLQRTSVPEAELTSAGSRANESSHSTTPRIAREIVPYTGPYGAGTVVVSTRERRLYFILPGQQAIRYAVGVGREGFEWSGSMTISMKQEWPDWRPPVEMLRRRPDLPRYMAGGPENPLGARALYLGDTLYRIHGSNEPDTIGSAVSSGCIRMLNDDVVDLYERVRIGTPVVVLR